MNEYTIHTEERAGMILELVQDVDPMSPRDASNVGAIIGWRGGLADWSICDVETGDPRPFERDCDECDEDGKVYGHVSGAWVDCPACFGDLTVTETLDQWATREWGATVAIPLRLEDHGSSGTRLYAGDAGDAEDVERAHGFILDTPEGHPHSVGSSEVRTWGEGRALLGEDWTVVKVREALEGEISELERYVEGDVYVVLVKDPDTGEIVEEVGSIIGYDSALEEGRVMADAAGAEKVARGTRYAVYTVTLEYPTRCRRSPARARAPGASRDARGCRDGERRAAVRP